MQHTNRSIICNAFCFGLILFSAIGSANAQERQDVFYVKPYVQLGNNPKLMERESQEIIWFTEHPETAWRLEIKHSGSDWTGVSDITKQKIPSAPKPGVYKMRCSLSKLVPGTIFDYRIIADGKVVFSAWAKVRKGETQPYTFDVFGDCGAGTVGQKLVAFQCYKQPMADFVVLPGDLVYPSGTFTEYLHKFFPVYNCDTVNQNDGTPLMRSIPFVGVVGNHDVASPPGGAVNLTRLKDALAYFFVWDNPSNGPIRKIEEQNCVQIQGNEPDRKAFLKSAMDNFPRGTIFSFDYGNCHWLALDGNAYMDWHDAGLRKWVEDDLTMSRARWKFVAYHQPAFSYDSRHSNEERMRQLCDIFQRTGVDIAFSGHAHDYQRTRPMQFKPTLKDGIPIYGADGKVPGGLDIDKVFDGTTHTKPLGLIHIVTGAGGAMLYGPKERVDPTRRSFLYMAKFISDVHSFTRCSVDGDKLELSQINTEGEVIDHVTITKN